MATGPSGEMAAEAADESAAQWLEAHDDPWPDSAPSPAAWRWPISTVTATTSWWWGSPAGPGAPRLAVVRGAGAAVGLPLPEAPAGLGAFGAAPAGAPGLLVAAGAGLLVYRNLRPFFTRRLPPARPPPARGRPLAPGPA
ncbi:Bardet-Biedl syndrome 1 protein-like, partial [Apteryx mantelli]|uniref:Bardet-Biedl syndrome 1 protein-like n=1 Tax=Apteryx mantelli TaxID=2696672 RepID=A0ABM4G7Y9_9AVES